MAYKEVYFNKYCNLCKHEKILEVNEPCAECLSNPVNVDSHKPVVFEEK